MSASRCRGPREGMRGGAGRAPSGSGSSEVQQDFNERRLIYKCRLDPSVDNSGYAGVVRVVRNGGSARMDNGNSDHRERVVGDAAHAHRMVRRLQRGQGGKLCGRRWKGSPPIIRRCWSGTAKVQTEALNRVTVDFGGASQDACLPRNFCPISGRGRTTRPRCYRRSSRWDATGSSSPAAGIAACRPRSMPILICKSRPVAGRSAGGHGCLLHWMESLAPGLPGQCQEHLRDARHTLSPYALKGVGVVFHWSSASSTGEMWPHPYWIFRRRLVCSPVLGSLSGYRDVNFPPQPRSAGI